MGLMGKRVMQAREEEDSTEGRMHLGRERERASQAGRQAGRQAGEYNGPLKWLSFEKEDMYENER